MPSSASRANAWERYFTTITRLTTHIEAPLKASCQLTIPEYNVLLHTQRAGGDGIRPRELAREVVFSPSRLTHTLKRLIDRGLLNRAECATDGRGGVISITPEGEKLFNQASQIHRATVRSAVLDDLTDEEAATLDRVFERIRSRLG